MTHPRDDEWDEAPPQIEPVRRTVPIRDVINRSHGYAPAEPSRRSYHGWRRVLVVLLLPLAAIFVLSVAAFVIFEFAQLLLWWGGWIWSLT